jgi:small redox-active disulfide protein 2
MEIKILGLGCAKCKKLEKVAREVVAECGIDATVTKVTDPTKILRYPIIAVPGLVVDEEIKAFGRIPSKQEIARWLAEAEAERVPTDTTDA